MSKSQLQATSYVYNPEFGSEFKYHIYKRKKEKTRQRRHIQLNNTTDKKNG